MKIIFKIIKKIAFALGTLYSFNILMEGINLFIPINIFSVMTTSILGFPGLFLQVALKIYL